MGNQSSTSSGEKAQEKPPAPNSRDVTNDGPPNFPDFLLERGNLLDEEGDDVSSVSSDVSQSSAGAGGRPRTTTLKVFSSTDFRNQRLVGEGGFGKVLEGGLQGTRVAVKIFHAPLVMEEARGAIGPLMGLKHRNLVRIKGILTSTNFLDAGVVAMECPQVLLDYFPEGNLLQYLSKLENPQDYAMLGKLALDIVHGCEYLHSKDIIHGNLAARNVMVEKALSKQKTHFNAKVGDYGISRIAKGSGGNYMTLPTGKVVPIRWVPKELVMDANANKKGTSSDFSFASDVWSFGVVLWEMWTKGATPYGVSYTNMEVLEFLKTGKSPLTIHHPKGCPAHITAVMESIFKVNAYERPRFSMLKEAFEAFKQKAKAKNAKEPAESTQIKKPSTETEQNQCKKNDAPSVPSPADQNQDGKRKDSKVEVPAVPAVTKGETSKSSQGKPKKPANASDQQYKKPDKDQVRSSSNSNKQKHGNEQKPSEGGSNQSHKHYSGTSGGGNKGRGGGGTGGSARPKPQGRGHGHYTSGPSNHGKHSGSGRRHAPPPPPPYTPNPLPNHSAYLGPGMGVSMQGHPQMGFGFPSSGSAGAGPQPNFDDEIKRRQDEIKMLEAQRVTDEIRRKTAELADALQRAATIGINSATGANQMVGSNVSGFGMQPAQSEHAHHHHKSGRGHRGGGGGGGGRGRGGGGGSGKSKHDQVAS